MEIVILLLIILGIIALAYLAYYLFFRKGEKPQAENDAKRFAFLLVSEIKLSEDYKVQRGLKNNNLYESLHSEIEQARNKYKKLFLSPEFDAYFEEDLIKILADGDESNLGKVSPSLNK